ncbi:MAG TPA: SOS response-associated peptidase [Pirellulales bacterium]|nr:SOS response-associated peptidase [Pirellulales bacterium]
MVRWGLIPFWAKDPKIGSSMINARGDTVADKPAFKKSFRTRRCLVVADGFYEWQQTGGPKKQPFYIRLKNDRPFAFAGLGEGWSKSGTPIESCTLITTEPNELMEPAGSLSRGDLTRGIRPILTVKATHGTCWRMDIRIKALIGAHAVVFVIAAIAVFGLSGATPALLLFMALASADAALLGLWGAFGTARWQNRFYGVSAALLFLSAAFLFEQQQVTARDVVVLGVFISLPCIVIVLVLMALRRGPRQLALRRAEDAPAREGFQFSLYGLLVAVTGVAIALSVGRVTRIMEEAGTWFEVLALALILPPSFVLVALATFWAALGISRPLPRLLLVIPLAMLLGFASYFGLDSDIDWSQVFLWSCLTGTTATIIASSLLVVRSAGWRLCSAADEPQTAPETGIE